MHSLSIKSKLVALMLVSVLLITLMVSLSFRMLLNDVFFKDAQTKVENGVIHLADEIRNIKENLIDSTSLIVHNLNIDEKLKKINKNPNLLFKNIKEQIANELLNQLKYSFMDEIYIYDANHEMLAFVKVYNDTFMCGYQLNDDKKTIFTRMEYEEKFREAKNRPLIPQHVYTHMDPFSKSATTGHYRVFNNTINILSHREYLDNNEITGAISMVKLVDTEHLFGIAKRLDTDMQYIINAEDISALKEEYGIDLKSSSLFIPPLFSNIRNNLELLETKDEFLSVAAIQTDDESIYVVSKIKKDLLDAAVVKSKQYFILITSVFSILFVLIIVYIINEIIGKPLKNVLANTTIIKHGDYNNIKKYNFNNDEIGKISQTIFNMVDTIQEREKDLLTLNKELDNRVKVEVSKNRVKDKQMLEQSRLAQLGEMISMIAHQWRQPLASISATSMNLGVMLQLDKLKFNSQEDIEESKKYISDELAGINYFVKNLNTTIDDFRNFYKPNKEKTNTSFKKIMTSVMKIIGSSFEIKGIKLTFTYKSELELKLYDREMIQVILNILKNSQDNFLEKNTKNPQVDIVVQDNNTLSICDNGGGIDSEIQDRIFDPYFSTKDEKNGTGLGLYMSKTIIEDHHKGKLSFANQNDGVCFTIKVGNIE